MLNNQLLETVLARLPHATVGLIGDLFLDRYFDIEPKWDEPSVETGLTAYQVNAVRCFPGALGTVVNNLAALGVGRIVPVSILGDDGEAFELRRALQKMQTVDLQGLVTDSTRRTPTYTKPMYGHRELNRIDIKNRTPTPADTIQRLLQTWDKLWPQCDAWLVLDQVSEADTGVVTTTVRNTLEMKAIANPSRFVLADSRERIGHFKHVSVKPNEYECAKACGGGATDLARQTHGEVYCTRGANGITFVSGPGGKEVIIPARTVTGPVDICGAGDSCSAGITVAKLAGLNSPQAAAFGNLVASITVQQIGVTGTATPAQLRQALTN